MIGLDSVLIADENLHVRELICEYMNQYISQHSLGVQAVGCNGDPLKIMTLIDEIKPVILFLDLPEPENEHLKLLERIRMAHPDLPIITCSTNREPDVEYQARSRGARNHFSKPFGLDEVAECIKETLENLTSQ